MGVAVLCHILYNENMRHITWKSRKQNNRIRLSAVILFLILSTLTGCFPNNFTREEKNAFLREAREVASDYLSDRYSGGKIRKIEPVTIFVDDGYELSEFASGQFVWKRQTYDFVVNAETGEVYTSVYLDEIEERLKEMLFQELGIVGEETAVDNCAIYCLKDTEKVGEYYFQNVFPEEESAEKLLEKVLQDTETYRFSMWLRYKGEDLSIEMMELEAPFPTLSSVSIHHIAEEHALYVGEYHYSSLPIMAREIMELGFSQDTASYTRYQTLEQDGIRVVYNAYERTREQDTVTESVITEEDITLTVTDEFIRLDCAKDNYSMCLLTGDKKIAKKYLYVFASNRVVKGEETQKGVWYSFEDGYVYSDYYLLTMPYEIKPRYSEGNVIYSRPQTK